MEIFITKNENIKDNSTEIIKLQCYVKVNSKKFIKIDLAHLILNYFFKISDIVQK